MSDLAVTIQSVLDVKDNNPAPKGAGELFDRSILILTPERSLKFTATSSERHYLWLTALSFLAHSSQTMADLPALAVPPLPKVSQDESAAPKRRGGIRDSIRLAKTKTTAPRRDETITHALPILPAEMM